MTFKPGWDTEIHRESLRTTEKVCISPCNSVLLCVSLCLVNHRLSSWSGPTNQQLATDNHSNRSVPQKNTYVREWRTFSIALSILPADGSRNIGLLLRIGLCNFRTASEGAINHISKYSSLLLKCYWVTEKRDLKTSELLDFARHCRPTLTMEIPPFP
jgi:hypothetical protein